MAKSAWGIEAGTSSIKAIKLTHDGKGGVTLDDVSSHDLAHYYVDGGDERSALVRGLAALVAEKGLKPGDDIFVSLPSRNQISRVIALPPVGEDAIRETIVHEARGQIPIKLEDAVWDYHLVDNAEPGELLVNLYAVKRDVIDALLNLCNLAGLPVTGIQLAPLGIYNYVKHELDLEISESCVCIDIGADNTDLVIIDGQKTWLRTVPFAGNDITKALMMRFKKLTPAQAEKLKRKAAESKDAPKIFEAMKPPLKEMVGEVHRCVGFYKNQNENAQLNKLVMMGNGSKLFNIAKFFEQQLQYEVHRVEELTNIQLSRGVDPAKVQENVPSLVVAIGLALQAVGVPGMISTNLVPPELVKEEALKKVRPLALVAGGMVFVAGLAMFLMSLGPKGDAEEFTRTLGEDAGKIEQRRTELANQKARDEALNAEATTLNNTDRADDLPYLGYLFLRDTVREFSETKNPEAKFLWCMKRENRGALNPPPDPRFDSGCLVVKVTEAKYERKKIGGAPEGEAPPEDEDAPAPEEKPVYRFMRRVNVDLTMNLAQELPADGNAVKDARDKYQELDTFLRERLEMLFAPELDEAKFKEHFPSDSDMAKAMLRLRALVMPPEVPPAPAAAEGEEGAAESTGPVKRPPMEPGWKITKGQLENEGQPGDEGFMVFGGDGVRLPTTSETWGNRRFYYFGLTLSLKSLPWEGVPENEKKGE